MAENSIFRKKSMEKVSSPEQLNDYLRVSTPAVWIILAAILILLVGFIVWAVFGSVTIHDADGAAQVIHPITFIMN